MAEGTANATVNLKSSEEQTPKGTRLKSVPDDRSSDESDVSDSDEEEDPEDYKKGGYHPVTIGDVFKQRYKVVKKLGWGHFSTVWLVHDSTTDRFAALKIVKSAPHYTEAAEDEVKLLRAVREHDPKSTAPGHIVLLSDDFKHYGPHGAHVCMVMEVLGKNLLWIIKASNYKGIELAIVKRIIRQTLEGLQSLHTECGIIHTDIKPENILFCLTPEEEERLAIRATKVLSTTPTPPPSSAVQTNDGKKLTKTQKKNAKRRQKRKPDVKAEDVDTAKQSNLQADEDQPEEDKTATVKNSEKEDHVKPLPPARCRSGTFRKPVDLPVEIKQAIRKIPDMKIADLGNSCWVTKHFSPDIQTRQYRSIEVILGGEYDETADIWSVACMAFELATGDYLFEPHTGKDYSRDEDHCALIMELLGEIPLHVALTGEYCREVFNRKGELRHIHDLKPWSLHAVLHEKYHFSEFDAAEFAGFLLPMLAVDKAKRASATTCLKHPWLKTGEHEVIAAEVVKKYRRDSLLGLPQQHEVRTVPVIAEVE
eukprot:m.100865 g.100865  ORF g.100865 m.100865 type:complete len:537 (+) comp27282_c0_seq1:293-1903(+)